MYFSLTAFVAQVFQSSVRKSKFALKELAVSQRVKLVYEVVAAQDLMNKLSMFNTDYPSRGKHRLHQEFERNLVENHDKPA